MYAESKPLSTKLAAIQKPQPWLGFLIITAGTKSDGQSCYTTIMSFFSSRPKTDTYGVLFDIGSGSVLTAIVHSKQSNPHPSVVWSHREHVPLRNIESLEQVSKSVMTALINAAMELDSNGRKVLAQYNSSAKISEIQTIISAPWSHTVTKTINYTQEEPFTINTALIAELIKTAEGKIAQELKTDETLDHLGLSTVATATMDMHANGYRVSQPQGGQATQFSITRANVAVQKYINIALSETIERIFPSCSQRSLSFMLMAYNVIQDLLPRACEIGIVDVTYEATELGIVRDGALEHSTHTPFGSFSLARELSAVLDVPLSEAFGYLHSEQPLAFLSGLSKAKKSEVEIVFDAYVDKIAALFKETGDELSIPKTIVLHADLHSEPLFLHLVEKAAKRSTKSAPVITLITQEILKLTFDDKATKEFLTRSSDTALLLAALFFHKQHDSTTFTYV